MKGTDLLLSSTGVCHSAFSCEAVGEAKNHIRRRIGGGVVKIVVTRKGISEYFLPLKKEVCFNCVTDEATILSIVF